MKTISKPKRQTLNDLPQDQRGPPQNRYGGHQTQKMKALRGNTFGAANKGHVFTEEQKAAWSAENCAMPRLTTASTHRSIDVDMKRELYEWFRGFDWDIAATLTFANDYTEKQALAAAKEFWNEVDYGVYSNAARRFNKRCQRVMMLEGDGEGQRVHFHGAILTPRDRFEDDLAFCRYLENKWLKINPRSVKVEFKPVWSAEGWSWYVTKKASHFDCDSFDVHSSHIAAPNLLTASRAQAAA